MLTLVIDQNKNPGVLFCLFAFILCFSRTVSWQRAL